ncbi:MAG TPA: helix-turn-helix domain-containing protein [Solidesulfovibrio magneticus]|nr:helix-turn-helix domain-containing protein [Solidesulfovibrio magneticus]
MRQTNIPYDRSAHGQLLNVKQVTERLGCGKTFVYDLIRQGELRSVRLGVVKGLRVTAKSVERYMKSKGL